MTRRISDSTTGLIAEMLIADNKTQGDIAKATGVSPSLVSQIKSGKREVPGVEPSLLVPRRARKDDQEEFPSPSGPAVRCPTCRRKVQMSCVACRTTAWMRRRAWMKKGQTQ